MDYESALNETRTNAEQSETSGDFRVSYESQPLPYTLLVKGWFWYFRTRLHGTVRIKGEYRSPVFMRHYHRLCREHGKYPEIKTDKREVYFLGWEGGPVKIGISNSNADRITALQNACPYKLEIYATTKGGRALERVYHRRFAKHKLRGEWFERCSEIEAEIHRVKTGGCHGSL